jgi:leucyl/phenylalanyl-tRNA--protein transferase
MHAVEPPPSRWQFPAPSAADPDGLVGIGGDLEPGTVLAAYRQGLFPMPVGRHLAWWSPDPRGVLDGFRVSRSLRRTRRRFEIRVDTAFTAVMDGCADRRRPGGWITPAVRRAYTRLHDLGWAHSIEAWSDDLLAGGVYGVQVGGLFAAESMFHRETDASKAALAALCERLGDRALIDVQWCTPHLASLGASELAREDYLERLAAALAAPPAALG